ncbi:isoleucine--tRNA ligase [Candidatus Pacearchaeota archaeon CG1_02_32_132]|nr:MAG: isoleucine--tRNA ligase [Candidatus Pacearchaeota archaeon CG1_02_32_132]
MFDLKKIEEEVLKVWEKNKIYEKVKQKNVKGKKFYFLQGPPYTSGKIHIGQAWNNSLKDMILRYKRMKGFNVWDRGGYDMHGLPTENAVQKKLGLKSKEDIEKYGVDKFVKECMDWSTLHADYMSKDLWNIGVWLDYKNAYRPVKMEYVSGEWAFFKKAWEQDRLYKGKKVIHWDSDSETSLAKHELEYENVKDESIFLKFRSKEADEYFIIWTTTPWTIPFNLGIMVNPKVDYVRIKVENEKWIIAKTLAESFVSGLLGKKFKTIDEFKGKKLEGQEYFPVLYDELKETYDALKKKWPKVYTVLLSEEYVDTSAGTGLVHCAPGCGPEDQEVGEKYGIGVFNTLSERGRFENLGKYTGWTAKEDDKKFIEEFENKGVLVAKTKIEHEYPHSWRSHKPVIFRPTEQWFVKVKDSVPQLLKFDEKVKWVPEKSGERYRRWTENLRDINITRQRYWGCPVPIWVNEKDEKDFFVVGSVEELEKLTGKKLNDISVHRPWVDKILIEKKGKMYRRIDDVADVWIDSGTASWNCLYNNPKLIKEWFPADLILEGTDQIRLWFSVLQIYSSIYMGKSAYKNIYNHGMILDYQGTKMSKSLGNIISPYEVIDKYSVDIMRNYLCSVSAGENINFSWEDIKVKQKNLIILSNISNYIIDLESQKLKKGKPGLEEKWILSKYNNSLNKISKLFEEYRLDETIREIEILYISLSRDYIRFVRDKANEDSAVLDTLKEVYLGVLKMFSTVCPFITESLWQKMNQKEESIHLCKWPKIDMKKANKKLEDDFEIAMQVIEKGLAERDKEKIGLRWPLADASYDSQRVVSKEVEEVIKNQLNVKKIIMKIIKENTNINVSLNLKVTPELEAEGFVREMARRIQAERKNRGLKKMDRIELRLLMDSDLRKRIEKIADMLKERTGAKKIEFTDDEQFKGESFKVKDREIRFNFE